MSSSVIDSDVRNEGATKSLGFFFKDRNASFRLLANVLRCSFLIPVPTRLSSINSGNPSNAELPTYWIVPPVISRYVSRGKCLNALFFNITDDSWWLPKCIRSFLCGHAVVVCSGKFEQLATCIPLLVMKQLHGWGHGVADALAINKAHMIISVCMACGIITAFLPVTIITNN